jgi:protoporphyrinogen oxidase
MKNFLSPYINAVYGGSLDNMAYHFSRYCDESLQIRKLRNAKEEKNTMPISKKTLRQPRMLLGVVQALGGLLGCLS